MSVFELRHYIPAPGKAEALANRFRNGTFQLLDKLGYKVAHAWEAADGSGELWYLMEWSSHEEMRAAWESFPRDPDWQRLKAETEAAGPLVAKIETFPLTSSATFAEYVASAAKTKS